MDAVCDSAAPELVACRRARIEQDKALLTLVRDYRAGLGMPRRAKVVAITMMWLAIALSAYLVRDNGWAIVGIVALGVIGTVYLVWRVPTREAVAAARSI